MKESIINRVLRHIVDYPGCSSAEIADALELDAETIAARLGAYMRDGRVRFEIDEGFPGRKMYRYYPGQSLVREVNGVKQIISGRQSAVERTQMDGAEVSGTVLADAGFACGLMSNGQLIITQRRKSMSLSREEAARLIAYLDCINIDRAVGIAPLVGGGS